MRTDADKSTDDGTIDARRAGARVSGRPTEYDLVAAARRLRSHRMTIEEWCAAYPNDEEQTLSLTP